MSLVCSIDAGTTYVKVIVFKSGTEEIVGRKSVQTETKYPQDGWQEFDPLEVTHAIEYCLKRCLKQMKKKYTIENVKAIGLANQRETTVVWDKYTGKPLHNAILWSDSRTSEIVEELLAKQPVNGDKYYFQTKTGLPIANFFSAVKIKWLINNISNVKRAVERKRCLFGTLDSWILWNFLDKKHYTDVTNASRTLLMNIRTLEWDDEMLSFFNIPAEMLPEIKSNAEMYGYVEKGSFKGVPITGCIADQQASLIGQGCFTKGTIKATYGTGCFVLYNTGSVITFSNNGMLTTVGYKVGKSETHYALEGAIAVGGEAFKRLRDELEIISDYSDMEYMARNASQLDDIVYFTTMHELFATNWHKQTGGMLSGCSAYTNHNNIVRAAMETLCFLVVDVINAIKRDTGCDINCLKADGSASMNVYLMQMQADLGGFEVLRSIITENSCLGAAQVALWGIHNDEHVRHVAVHLPQLMICKSEMVAREKKYKKWKDTVLDYKVCFG